MQPRNRLRRRQVNRQLQLCVPLVVTNGESFRLAQATTGKGVTPLAT
jgi:hypothetical protein